MTEPEVSIVMPCLNEAETLAACIDKARRALGGINAAREQYVIMGDADDSDDFSDLTPFVERLRAGDDLVMGNRFKGGAMPVSHRYVGNPVLTAIGYPGRRRARVRRSTRPHTEGPHFLGSKIVPARIAPEDVPACSLWHPACGRRVRRAESERLWEVSMARRITFALVASLVLAGPALAAEGERHSGRIVEVRPDGTLVLEEMGPWKGPGTGLVRHTFHLAPNTAVGEVRAKATWDPNDVVPGYDVRPLDLTQVKPGDFVTVITSRDRRAGAIALDVVRPEATEGGLASPPTEPRT